LASLLALVPKVAGTGGKELEDLLSPVNDCYEILLPLAVSSSNIDALLACTSSFLASSSRINNSAEWTRTAGLLCASLDALPNDRNTQKKVRLGCMSLLKVRLIEVLIAIGFDTRQRLFTCSYSLWNAPNARTLAGTSV
jgi:hypothetical protein